MNGVFFKKMTKYTVLLVVEQNHTVALEIIIIFLKY